MEMEIGYFKFVIIVDFQIFNFIMDFKKKFHFTFAQFNKIDPMD